MNDVQIIDLTPDNISDYGVCGYKDVQKHIELRNKIEWFKEYYPKGLRIKIVFSQKGGYQGMLEYIPGEYAHRPVVAEGYQFIHCVFVGFKNEFKGRGFGSFCLIYNGKIISHHPISNTRFMNIMKKELNKTELNI